MRFLIFLFSVLCLFSCNRQKDFLNNNDNNLSIAKTVVERTNDQNLVLEDTFYAIEGYFNLFYNIRFYLDKKNDEIFTDDLYFKSDGDKIRVILFRNGALGHFEINKTTYKDVVEEIGPPDIVEREFEKIIYFSKKGDEVLTLYFSGGMLEFIVYNLL